MPCQRVSFSWRGSCRIAPLPWLLVVSLISAAGCNSLGPEEFDLGDPVPGQMNVLFIGSSYLAVNNMPAVFLELARAGGKDPFVAARVQSGHYLDFFAADSDAEMMIRNRNWDFVILSGGCQTAAYPDTHHQLGPDWGQHPVYPSLETLKRKVRENHAGTVLIYIMPWAFEDGMTWVQGQTDTYFDMQLKIRENALRWADSLDITVAPVGMAWAEIMGREIPEHYLHMTDWNHPSPRGTYLSAATLFATVFRESAEDADYSWILDPVEADTLRGVGSATVLDSLSLWNIGHQ